MTTVWFIHGAGASRNSFNWLTSHLNNRLPLKREYFEYDVNKDSLQQCIERLKHNISDDETIIIGHSYGGLIAAGQTDNPNVKGIITLCAPFGGLAMAMILSMARPHQMFRDLNPINRFLIQLRIKLDNSSTPHLPIVANHGLPFTNEINDGVVSLDSQTAILATCKVVPVNHFEVLLSPEVGTLIEEFLTKIIK